jgi:hypothetical protein
MKTKGNETVTERGCQACTYVSDTMCYDAECAIWPSEAGPRWVPDAGK